MNNLKNNLNQTLISHQNHPAYDSLINSYLNTPLDLLNSIQDFIIIYNTNLQVVWANRSVHKYMSKQDLAAEKLSCHKFCGHPSEFCVICSIKLAIETRQICENERYTSDGITLGSKAIPLIGESEEVVGILEISKDISAEKELEKNYNHIDQEVNSINGYVSDVTIRLNHSGETLYVSPNFCKLLHLGLDEIMGKPFTEYIADDDILITKHAFEKTALPPYHANFECRLKTKEGLRWFEWTGKAITDNNADVVSMVFIGRDISLQKSIEDKLRDKNKAYEKLNEQLFLQNENYEKITRELLKRNNQVEELYLRLKESEERFRNMFVKHSSIMFLFDPDTFEIIDSNIAAQHYYGYSEDEFFSKTLMDLNLVPREEIEQRFAKSIERNHQYAAFKHKLSDGTVRDVEVYSVPIMYKDEEVHFSIVYDVTKRKKAEKKLTESKRKLKEANDSKDKFFSIIAHDLKNPFNSLIGLTDFLELNADTISKHHLKDLIHTLGEVSRQGYNLLENLLQWSRTQMGNLKVVIEPLNIAEIINETILLLKNNADTKGIRIFVDSCDQVIAMADANMIATVIRNLLANAIKYSFRNGNVYFRCNQQQNELAVSVVDEGQGIQPEDLKNLFRIDMNVSTLGTEKETGTGLGLILCKEFIERCKGKFTVNSEPGLGSTFTFTLPTAISKSHSIDL